MCRCKAAVPPCPPFCLGPAHAFPMRIPQLGYGRAETGWSGLLFPQIPSKIKLFLSAACRNFPHMAAKLRPAGRRTTPPGRAGKFPACSAKKQFNFFTGLWEKQSAPSGFCSAISQLRDAHRETAGRPQAKRRTGRGGRFVSFLKEGISCKRPKEKVKYKRSDLSEYSFKRCTIFKGGFHHASDECRSSMQGLRTMHGGNGPV